MTASFPATHKVLRNVLHLVSVSANVRRFNFKSSMYRPIPPNIYAGNHHNSLKNSGKIKMSLLNRIFKLLIKST